jgi:hypothetical protein
VGEYGEIPADLPAVWAELGYRDRAESLAQLIVEYDKAQALARLAGPMGAAGEVDRAERLVRSVTVRPGQIREPYDKTRAWTDLAWLATISGDRERASRLIRQSYTEARSVTLPYLQSQLLLAWARVHAAGGDRSQASEMMDRAQTLASSTLNAPSWWQWVLAALPVVVTSTGDLARAEALVRTVPDEYQRARAAAQVAVMMAARGGTRRVEALLRLITDEFRRGRVEDALATIRGLERRSEVDPYREARVLASLADVVAAGGPGHAWGVSDWAEPLVRYGTEREDQVLIFAALAAGAAGGDAGRAGALADRAEAIVAPISDPELQPQALVALAWMVADAGDPARAAELANAAEGLARYTKRFLRTWRVADLAAMAAAGAGERRADGLPALAGTPKQRQWAQNLRGAYVTQRWGEQVPAEAMAQLAGLTQARWWINNRDNLDDALGNQTGMWNDDNLPELVGTPKQEDWARKLRAALISEQWPGELPPRVAKTLAKLTDAQWWIENRENLSSALAEHAAAYRMSELPKITGASGYRARATEIRLKLVRKRWGDKVPPGVWEALNRLTDAEWWIDNELGDGRPQAIDRAVGAEVPEHDRKMMALPQYGQYKPRHPGPCSTQPEYAPAREAAFTVASTFGDLRAGTEGSLSGLGGTCCGRAGFRDGERDGKNAWVDGRAAAIRGASGRLTLAQAQAQARSELARLERNLDGWG